MNFKKDFPLLVNHPETIYLDSAATAQKPSYVIDEVTHYLCHDYANIHRGRYDLSVASEELYWQARKKVAALINGRDDEVIFTSNSTGASNLLIQSLTLSGTLKPGDKVLTSITAHHAALVPWQLVAKFMDIEIVFVGLDENGSIDIADFTQKYDERVKIVSLPFISNVIGQKDDLDKIKNILRDNTLYILDASQAIVHTPVDVQQLGCDFLFFTGHKLFAYTGIGILRGKQKHLKSLQPAIAGGGAIESVASHGYTLLEAPDKFEPGTPNLVGAVSLLRAIEYMEQVGEIFFKTNEAGDSADIDEHIDAARVVSTINSPVHTDSSVALSKRYDAIEQMEKPLIEYSLGRFAQLAVKGITLLGTTDPSQKIGLFSFILPSDKSPAELGQYMAKQHICIRCGGQCAQPLHEVLGKQGSCRISFSIYTTMDDLVIFFDTLEKFLASK